MFVDTTITVQNKDTTFDTEGMSLEVWTANETTLAANHQPLSGEIAYKEYGISDASLTDLFFTPVHTAIATKNLTAKITVRIIDGSEAFDVYRVEPFSAHYEVICRPVVGE